MAAGFFFFLLSYLARYTYSTYLIIRRASPQINSPLCALVPRGRSLLQLRSHGWHTLCYFFHPSLFSHSSALLQTRDREPFCLSLLSRCFFRDVTQPAADFPFRRLSCCSCRRIEPQPTPTGAKSKLNPRLRTSGARATSFFLPAPQARLLPSLGPCLPFFFDLNTFPPFLPKGRAVSQSWPS